MDQSTSAWADRWITIQWVLLGLAAAGFVVVAFCLRAGQDTTPVHGR